MGKKLQTIDQIDTELTNGYKNDTKVKFSWDT